MTSFWNWGSGSSESGEAAASESGRSLRSGSDVNSHEGRVSLLKKDVNIPQEFKFKFTTRDKILSDLQEASIIPEKIGNKHPVTITLATLVKDAYGVILDELSKSRAPDGTKANIYTYLKAALDNIENHPKKHRPEGLAKSDKENNETIANLRIRLVSAIDAIQDKIKKELKRGAEEQVARAKTASASRQESTRTPEVGTEEPSPAPQNAPTNDSAIATTGNQPVQIIDAAETINLGPAPYDTPTNDYAIATTGNLPAPAIDAPDTEDAMLALLDMQESNNESMERVNEANNKSNEQIIAMLGETILRQSTQAGEARSMERQDLLAALKAREVKPDYSVQMHQLQFELDRARRAEEDWKAKIAEERQKRRDMKNNMREKWQEREKEEQREKETREAEAERLKDKVKALEEELEQAHQTSQDGVTTSQDRIEELLAEKDTLQNDIEMLKEAVKEEQIKNARRENLYRNAELAQLLEEYERRSAKYEQYCNDVISAVQCPDIQSAANSIREIIAEKNALKLQESQLSQEVDNLTQLHNEKTKKITDMEDLLQQRDLAPLERSINDLSGTLFSEEELENLKSQIPEEIVRQIRKRQDQHTKRVEGMKELAREYIKLARQIKERMNEQ